MVKTCRQCGVEFQPTPGKPGYIDECLECLTARNLPPPKPPQPLWIYDKRPRSLTDILLNVLIWLLLVIIMMYACYKSR